MNLPTESCLNTIESNERTTAATMPRILIVDDEAGICGFIAELLNENDYVADTGASADIALKKLRTGQYDLLLTDYHMPRMTGCELISEMRAAGIHIPVILMSGHSGDLLAHHPDLQVNAVLDKPFLIQELMDALTSVLSPTKDAPAMMINLADAHESRRTCFF